MNRSALKRSRAVSPASVAQRLKVEAQGCRLHGDRCPGPVDPAHVIDRSIGGCDDVRCVVGLCRLVHSSYDDHRFDVLPLLTLDEQAHAVEHLGLLRALRRVTGTRWQPSDVTGSER